MRRVLSLLSLSLLPFLSPTALMGQSRPPGAAPISMAIGFGSAVAISGDEMLIGRPGQVLGFPMPASQTGAVYIFRRGPGGGWAQTATATASGLTIQDGFGTAISVDGYLMAVGAPGTSEERGAVYVFEREASARWVERARLTAASSAAGDRLGRAVALRGGVLLAGSPGKEDRPGRVVVFTRGGNSWTEQGTLVGSSADPKERFGIAVALTNQHALVGAPGQVFGDSAGAGRAVVFRRSGDTWVKESVLGAQ
ncbi:MAG TPA: hypothetical protein VFZ87_00540, partial [Gemmatimonadales bacterium]